MGVGPVIATFVMCFLFNIILPTGDVGSDLNLMYLALTFDLGDSLELEGCKSCYYKTENEVYHIYIQILYSTQIEMICYLNFSSGKIR